MKLLLDEHFAYAIAEELSRRGVDAVAITKDRPALAGQDDDVVLRGATVEGRVVVTNNVRDFAPLVESFGLNGEQQYGVLFTDDDTFQRGESGIGLLVRSLEAFAADRPDDWLLDSCIYLEPVSPSRVRSPSSRAQASCDPTSQHAMNGDPAAHWVTNLLRARLSA